MEYYHDKDKKKSKQQIIGPDYGILTSNNESAIKPKEVFSDFNAETPIKSPRSIFYKQKDILKETPMKDYKTFIDAKSLKVDPLITATELSDDSYLDIDPGASPELPGNSCNYDRFSQYSDKSGGKMEDSLMNTHETVAEEE